MKLDLTLSAKKLRIILFAIVILLAVGGVAGFTIARGTLQDFATSISKTEADAKAIDQNTVKYKQLETTLKNIKNIKERADSVAVPASEYPVAVIANITRIAGRSGVAIESIGYGDSSGAESNSGTAAPGNPPATGAPPTSLPNGAPQSGISAQPSTATKKMINVTLKSPVGYDALMNFIKGIENDSMYLHITSLSITNDKANAVTVLPFTIEVYVR